MSELIPLHSRNEKQTDAEAIKYAKNKVKENPHDASTHFYLACLLYHLVHDTNGAIKEFEKCLECDHFFLDGYKSLAYCQLEVQDKEKAEKTLKKALKIAPDDPDILYNYADLLKRTGKYPEARYYFTRASKSAPGTAIKKKLQKSIAALDNILNQPEPSPQWAMAKKDWNRSSCVQLDKSRKMINIRHHLSCPFARPIDRTWLPDIPSPIAAGDIIIFPSSTLKSFEAVNASNGEEVAWKSGIIADRLTYSSTPVYLPPSLFFFLGNSLKRLDLRKPGNSIEPLETDLIFHLLPYCAPAAFLDKVIFTFREGIYCYDTNEEKGNFLAFPGPHPEAIWRSPVICHGDLIALSKEGEIISLDLLKGTVIKEDKIPIKGVYSAPCAVEDQVYFEIFDQENHRRKAAAYSTKDGSLAVKELECEACSSEDLHFNFSPLVYQDSVLVASDLYPIFYQLRRTGSTMEVFPLELDIQVGNQKIVRVAHEFSTVIGTYIISKCEGGFFYVNLENPGHNRIENLMSEMAAQPVINRDRIYLLCQGGIEIFHF